MLKLNDKGFMMVETLIAAVFAVTIFTVIYVNFYPLIGEYERREVYDDVDGKYASYWFKRIIQSNSVSIDTFKGDIETKKYHKFSCDDVNGSDYSIKALCNNLYKSLQVENIYLIEFNTVNFKNAVNNDLAGTFSSGLHDYMAFLPQYKVASLNEADYRMIVEYHRTKDDNDYYAYSTIEVKKK